MSWHFTWQVPRERLKESFLCCLQGWIASCSQGQTDQAACSETNTVQTNPNVLNWSKNLDFCNLGVTLLGARTLLGALASLLGASTLLGIVLVAIVRMAGTAFVGGPLLLWPGLLVAWSAGR